ncbi:hypothetical protein GCM10027275_48130 [Rhabdobacter roseus]|uniref:Uncharacterized protein n=1 Tax=Rhabdobacter roseus TaxID=1655419 RepID=A0A840TUF2_9BACT|nr:hypothetical protein [Rhabdobacter roseus]MBB5286874.1 hypothetical protein [Rhabdobacter roseus]
MTYCPKTIAETDNQLKINDISIPKLKRGQLNTYNSTQIKAVGVDAFLDLVCETEPIQPPDLGFTEAEWDEMETLLQD